MNKTITSLITVIFLSVSHTAFAAQPLLDFVKQLSDDVREVYVLESKVPGVLLQLTQVSALIKQGEITTKQQLASHLSSELSKVDKHFSVSAISAVQQQDISAKGDPVPSYESYWQMLDRKNSGIQRVEILEGNVGYLNLTGFDKLNRKSRKRIGNAMAMLRETDSVIVDLTANGGGSPDMVALLAGYFFAEEMPLSSIYNRAEDRLTEFETEEIAKRDRLDGAEVFILTSSDTFSAAEAFAYDMQQYSRAVILGENTGGGANPIRFYQYPQGFEVALPYAMAINPVTKSNWEGVGVSPNIKVKRDMALDAAYCLALFANSKKTDDQHLLKELKKKIELESCGDA